MGVHNMPSIFRPPKNKRFNYKPRYYDPEKEELRKKIEYEMKEEKDQQERELNIRHEFQSMRKANQSRKGKRTMRILLIIGGLLALFYVLMFF